ncbi:MAG: DUF6933 domain-containing protein, partial [Algiphilus sp.]
VVAVNARTRFGVVMEGAPYKTVPARLTAQIHESLCMIGIPEAEASAEASATSASALAPSNSRSVLATINQYSRSVEARLRAPLPPATFEELNALLAEQVVLKPEDVGFPADRVREFFGFAPFGLRRDP